MGIKNKGEKMKQKIPKKFAIPLLFLCLLGILLISFPNVLSAFHRCDEVGTHDAICWDHECSYLDEPKDCYRYVEGY